MLNGRKPEPIALFHVAAVLINCTTSARARAFRLPDRRVFTLNLSVFSFSLSLYSVASRGDATANPANRFYANTSFVFIAVVYAPRRDSPPLV